MEKHGTGSGSDRPASQNSQNIGEEILGSTQLQIDRKLLILTLKKNAHGEFLRICEQAGSHQNTIAFPASGIGDLKKALDELQKNSRR